MDWKCFFNLRSRLISYKIKKDLGEIVNESFSIFHKETYSLRYFWSSSTDCLHGKTQRNLVVWHVAKFGPEVISFHWSKGYPLWRQVRSSIHLTVNGSRNWINQKLFSEERIFAARKTWQLYLGYWTHGCSWHTRCRGGIFKYWGFSSLWAQGVLSNSCGYWFLGPSFGGSQICLTQMFSDQFFWGGLNFIGPNFFGPNFFEGDSIFLDPHIFGPNFIWGT